MSKTLKPIGSPKAKGNKSLAALAHLQKIADAIKARATVAHLVLAFAVGLTLLLIHSAPLGAGSYAMLYLIADNGKKSGRADGNVYMRNGRVRGFKVPALVQNGFTTSARALLSALSSAWNGLDDATRATWNNIDWLFRSNRFGQTITVKGKQAFVMLNGNLTNVGAGLLTDAPAGGLATPGITSGSLALDQSTPTFAINFAPTPTDADVDHMIFATKPLNPGVSRPRASDFRWLGSPALSTTVHIGPGVATGMSIQSAYEEKYGTAWSTAPYNGKKVFVLLKPINLTTGEEGANIVIEGTIAA